MIVIQKNSESKKFTVHRDKLKLIDENREPIFLVSSNTLEKPKTAFQNPIRSRAEWGSGQALRRPQRDRRQPEYLDNFNCRSVFNSRCRNMVRVRQECEICQTTYRDGRDYDRHVRSMWHRARATGASIPPRSRCGIATRRVRVRRDPAQPQLRELQVRRILSGDADSQPYVAPRRIPTDEYLAHVEVVDEPVEHLAHVEVVDEVCPYDFVSLENTSTPLRFSSFDESWSSVTSCSIDVELMMADLFDPDVPLESTRCGDTPYPTVLFTVIAGQLMCIRTVSQLCLRVD